MYATWAIVQCICVIANGCCLLLNYSNYRKHHAKLFLGLLAYSAFAMLFCGIFLIYDAGKVSGVW